MRFLLWWALNLFALWIAAELVEGITYDDFWKLIIAALIFGIINLFLRPILVLLTLPAVILTLGLLLIVINAFLLWLTGKLVPGFDVADFFWAAILGALIIAIVNFVLDLLLPDTDDMSRAVSARL
jgi:putative membrane protein